jgi:hypothetical protein
VQAGNIERFVPLLLALFIVAAAVAIRGWALAKLEELPASSRGVARGSGITLVVSAAFVALGLHLPTLVDALRDHRAERPSWTRPRSSGS